jgi:hypothetical protein
LKISAKMKTVAFAGTQGALGRSGPMEDHHRLVDGIASMTPSSSSASRGKPDTMVANWKFSPVKAAARDGVIRANINGGPPDGYIAAFVDKIESRSEAIYERILKSASSMFDDDEDTPTPPATATSRARSIRSGRYLGDKPQASAANVSVDEASPHRGRVKFTEPPALEFVGPALPANNQSAGSVITTPQRVLRADDQETPTNLKTPPLPFSRNASLPRHPLEPSPAGSDIPPDNSSSDYMFSDLFGHSVLHEPIPPDHVRSHQVEGQKQTEISHDVGRDDSYQQDDFLNTSTGSLNEFPQLRGNEYATSGEDRSQWTKYTEDAELMGYTSHLIMLTEEFGDDIPDFSTRVENTSKEMNTISVAQEIERALKEHLRIPLATLQLSVLNTVR